MEIVRFLVAGAAMLLLFALAPTHPRHEKQGHTDQEPKVATLQENVPQPIDTAEIKKN